MENQYSWRRTDWIAFAAGSTVYLRQGRLFRPQYRHVGVVLGCFAQAIHRYKGSASTQ